jgi:hypothetical protein
MFRLILCILCPPLIPIFLLYSIFTGGSGVKKALRENGRALGHKMDLQILATLDPDAARAQIKREQDQKVIGGIISSVVTVGIILFVVIHNHQPTTEPERVKATVYAPVTTTMVTNSPTTWQHGYDQAPTTEPTTTASISNPPPPLLPHQPASTFMQGHADRQSWEDWFNNLPSGQYREGALFWTGQRSKPYPAPCYTQGGRDLGVWSDGCMAAQQRLGPSDTRRKNEPDYRQGWNSWSATQ